MLSHVAVLLGVIAGGIQLWGYGSYIKRVERPNTASWAIWTLGAVLDLVSYLEMTQDWAKNILPAVCAVACIWVFEYTLVRRRFGRLSTVDWTFLIVDLLITVWWFAARDATHANLLYQVSTLASFVPILLGVLRNGDAEHPRPWLIWSFAYAFFLVSVAMRHPRIEELAYPIVNLLCHAAMFVAVLSRKRSGH